MNKNEKESTFVNFETLCFKSVNVYCDKSIFRDDYPGHSWKNKLFNPIISYNPISISKKCVDKNDSFLILKNHVKKIIDDLTKEEQELLDQKSKRLK